MPTFPRNPLENLALGPGQVDETIDLGNADAELALARVAQLIESAPAGHCYALRFAPPRGDGSQTLFQPLGRYLLEARRNGRLARCLPASDGAGYVIAIADQ